MTDLEIKNGLRIKSDLECCSSWYNAIPLKDDPKERSKRVTLYIDACTQQWVSLESLLETLRCRKDALMRELKQRMKSIEAYNEYVPRLHYTIEELDFLIDELEQAKKNEKM